MAVHVDDNPAIDEADLSRRSFTNIFSRFCQSSTIHGTYFWSEARSPYLRFIWILIVGMGISSATYIINSSLKAWQDQPVVTSVTQKSIEEILFPAITLCPMDDSRLGVVESTLNKENPEDFPVAEIVTEILRLQFGKRPEADHGDCLIAKCEIHFQSQIAKILNETNTWKSKKRQGLEFEGSNCQATCLLEKEFKAFFDSVKDILLSEHINEQLDHDVAEMYHKTVLGRIKLSDFDGSNSVVSGKRMTREISSECHTYRRVSCQRLVADFRFLQEFETTIADNYQRGGKQKSKVGTLLKMLLSQLDINDRQSNQLFQKYIDKSKYPILFNSLLKGSANSSEAERMILPDLVSILANRHLSTEERERSQFIKGRQGLNHSTSKRYKRTKDLSFFEDNWPLEALDFGPDLLDTMKRSLHPPHVVENTETIPNAAFPFCKYDNDPTVGKFANVYKENYCQAFQTTFNEHGLCYTFNNFDQGMEERFRKYKTSRSESKSHVTLRKVNGCGKHRGFQLVIDSHLMEALSMKNHVSLGFKVFITMNGVVTSKVPFHVDPGFWGEYHFSLHGIHTIHSSDNFRNWNNKLQRKMCFFPQDRQLGFFKSYSQDNCLLECRLKKVSRNCGCAPWYLGKLSKFVCGRAGNQCFERELENYQDDLSDRSDCNCLNDCEMVHFFATMQREPFQDPSSEVDASHWFDPVTRTGVLSNYLLDPKNFFTDQLSKNITKLSYNLAKNEDLAAERFRRDIAILNFYFDTPIITGIGLELRTTIFDMISAIGGTLGLFTGSSVLTLVEIIYWLIVVILEIFRRLQFNDSFIKNKVDIYIRRLKTPQHPLNVSQQSQANLQSVTVSNSFK